MLAHDDDPVAARRQRRCLVDDRSAAHELHVHLSGRIERKFTCTAARATEVDVMAIAASPLVAGVMSFTARAASAISRPPSGSDASERPPIAAQRACLPSPSKMPVPPPVMSS